MIFEMDNKKLKAIFQEKLIKKSVAQPYKASIGITEFKY
jgi:hypothetical protein